MTEKQLANRISTTLNKLEDVILECEALSRDIDFFLDGKFHDVESNQMGNLRRKKARLLLDNVSLFMGDIKESLYSDFTIITYKKARESSMKLKELLK